jgi:hypothetical protein
MRRRVHTPGSGSSWRLSTEQAFWQQTAPESVIRPRTRVSTLLIPKGTR